jgi:aminobenzoyl-glutamate utilization protein B
MSYHQELSDIIDQKSDILIDASEQIWNHAELRFEEYQSAELLCQILENEGFHVERGVAGMETAFVASYGSGGPIVALLGEYDALASLSQKNGVARKEPVVEGGSGHGCGHNLLGVGALAAAVALRHYFEAHNISGTIRYYGCPAEEGGGGKGFMARAGLFDDVDFALTWHPDDTPAVYSFYVLATRHARFKFTGRSTHAALYPHLGRSALDAVELMNVGVNYLREHLIPEARVHYAVTNTGGVAPNVVQAEAEVHYQMRAPQAAQVREIYERICKVARGATMMTETEVEISISTGFSNLIPNTTLETVMQKNLEALGIPAYDDEELAFAREIRATFTDAERDNYRYPAMRGKELPDVIAPYQPKSGLLTVSTDVGDVSWVVPTAQFRGAIRAMGTPAHSWQAVAQGITSFAHKGMLHAGKVLASTAIDILSQPHLIDAAKAELKEALDGETYECPIPPEVPPRPASAG